MILWMQPRKNTVHAHRVVKNGNGQSSRAHCRRNKNMFPANSGDQQHRSADGGKKDSRAAIRLHENHSENYRAKGGGKKNSTFEGLHLPLITVAIPREHDDK